MVETHTRILGIAPYDGMRTAMEQAAQAYPNVELEVYTGDLEEGQAIVQRMAPNSYDCIISRGGTATLIRQVTDLPVVDIHISVYDVLRTMKLAENYTSLYAIVGFPSITEPAHTLCSLLNFDLDILTVRSAEEVRHTLERLKQGGYRMVVCDMVTHTIAREMGFDAFLITSGIESLHSAIDQAVNISTWFGQLRQENLFLRSITQEQGGRVVVMEPDGSLYYNNMKDISPELHRCLQTHLREIPATGSLKFYYTERSQLYSITAQVLLMNNVQRYLFYCVPSRIPLHSNRPGLRSLNKGECEYLFSNSFYSLSGAMGTQDAEINALAAVRQPLFICGEPGTGKTMLAQAVADALGKQLIIWNVKSTTKAQDGLYVYDVVQRLYDSQFGTNGVDDIARYIKMGKLGEAFQAEEQVVLLIDEIDKADLEFPNDLLWELDQMEFYIPETKETVKAKHRPIVIITSNAEKELPDAFLRRCVFHYIEFPDQEQMEQILRVHFGDLDGRLIAQALAAFYWVRSLREVEKKPSTSELVDWLRALVAGGVDPERLEKEIPFAGVLLKKDKDLRALQRARR